jgi:hypothetical protein
VESSTPVDEALDVLVHEGVHGDLVRPVRVLRAGRQLTVDEQVRGLQEVAPLRQLLDGIAAVEEDPPLAVDVGDPADARRGVEEGGVVGEEAVEVVVRHLDLLEIGGPDGAVGDRDLVGLPGPVVFHREGVGHVPESATSQASAIGGLSRV